MDHQKAQTRMNRRRLSTSINRPTPTLPPLRLTQTVAEALLETYHQLLLPREPQECPPCEKVESTKTASHTKQPL